MFGSGSKNRGCGSFSLKDTDVPRQKAGFFSFTACAVALLGVDLGGCFSHRGGRIAGDQSSIGIPLLKNLGQHRRCSGYDPPPT